MGVVIRQSAKSLLSTYAGVLIGIVNTLWLFPHFFAPEQYGLTQVLLAITAIFTQLSQLGTPATLTNFLPRIKEDTGKTGAFLSVMFGAPVAGFFFVALATLLFQGNIKEFYIEKSKLVTDYYLWVYPITFFYVYMYVLYSYCRTFLRIAFPTLVLDVMIKVCVSVELILFHFNFYSFTSFIMLFTLNYGIAALLLWIYSLKYFGLPLNFRFKNLSPSFYREITFYSLFVILGGASAGIVQKIDILMVSSMLGLSFTAVYSIAFFMGMAIEIPMRPVLMLSFPIVSEAWKNNDLKKISEVYRKSSINLFIIGCAVFLLVWTNIDELFSMIPKAEFYRDGKYVVLFILLAKLFDMVTGINGEIIRTSRYYYVDFITMFFLIGVSVLTNYFFIPLYGITGAAMATAISVFSFNLARFLFILLVFRMQPLTKKHIAVLAVSAASMVSCIFIPPLWEGIAGAVFTTIIRSSVMLSLFAILVYKMKLSEDINRVIRQPLKTVGFNSSL